MSEENWQLAVSESAGGALLRVKVVPGASRTKIAGLLGDRVKMQIAAPPQDGRANEAACELLAKFFSVSSRNVQVIEGPTQPRKTICITGLTAQQVIELLNQNV